MSIKELSFALKQENLAIGEHLAFIIIADSCDSYFTISQALEMILRRTHHSEKTAKEAIASLINDELIISTTRFQDDERLYLILAVQE